MLALTYKWSELLFNIPMTSCSRDHLVLVQTEIMMRYCKYFIRLHDFDDCALGV
jgi:hypothetical protein